MELTDGDFDDSAFGDFLARYPVDAVTGYLEDQPFPQTPDERGALPGDLQPAPNWKLRS